MISRYSNFITESTIVQLINESYLMGSVNFNEKLKLMSKSNKIAKWLYKLFDNESEIKGDRMQNYIDVDSEGTVSFMSDTKADKIKYEQNPFLSKGRSVIKIGRLVSSLLNDKDISQRIISDNRINNSGFKYEYNDKDIEEFVNLYKSINIDKGKKFKIVSGDEITSWYNEDSYYLMKGTLGSSCMKDVKASFFNIYTSNKNCRLLIYVNEENFLLGRALIWKLDSSPCKAEYFMDRVYTVNDSDVNRFKSYAEDQGWMYKFKMSSDFEESTMFYYKESPVFGEITVKLKDIDFRKYPYLDTLAFLDKDSKTLSNVGVKHCKVLKDVDGHIDKCETCNGSGKESCYYCENGEMDCQDCTDGELGCESCDGGGQIGNKKCKDCGGTGNVDCENCNGKGVVQCNRCKGRKCPNCVGVIESAIKIINDESQYSSLRVVANNYFK